MVFIVLVHFLKLLYLFKLRKFVAVGTVFNLIKVEKTEIQILLTPSPFQACIFNTWGPIAQSAKFCFGWTDATVAWTSNVQVVGSLLAAPLVLPVLQWLGLRRTVVWTGAGALALGAAVRCASLDGWHQQACFNHN